MSIFKQKLPLEKENYDEDFSSLGSTHSTECCGLVEISDFPILKEPLSENGFKKLQRGIVSAVQENTFEGKAIAFITLTEEQLKFLMEPLIKIGFRPGASGCNTRTGNNLTIFTMPITPVEVKKPKAKKAKKTASKIKR